MRQKNATKKQAIEETEDAKGSGNTYSWSKHSTEIMSSVWYLIANFPMQSVAKYAQMLQDELGMIFSRKDGAEKAVAKATETFQKKSIIAGAHGNDDDGKPCEVFTFTKDSYKGTFTQRQPDFLRPVITTMQLKANPETAEWIDFMETIMGGVKATSKKDRMILLRVTLRATQDYQGTKRLSESAEKRLLAQLNESAYDENNRVSFLPRTPQGLILWPAHYIKMAMKKAGGMFWGANIDYQLQVYPESFDPSVLHTGYKTMCDLNNAGTYVASFPVIRNSNPHSPMNPPTVKRAEVAPAGAEFVCDFHVAESQGVQSVLVPLSLGISMGAGRDMGFGTWRMVKFQNLGYIDTVDILEETGRCDDDDVNACNEALRQYLGDVCEEGQLDTPKKGVNLQFVYGESNANGLDHAVTKAKEVGTLPSPAQKADV